MPRSYTPGTGHLFFTRYCKLQCVQTNVCKREKGAKCGHGRPRVGPDD